MTSKKTCSITELEKQIFEREGITVVFREKSSTQVNIYDFERKLADNKNITDLKDKIDRTVNSGENRIFYCFRGWKFFASW